MKITKRKAKGVLADMIANMDEDSLARTREQMEGITEDYCSQEVVKLLKEKGFKIPQYYNSLINMWQDTNVTHQMAMKWLREKHIYICPVPAYSHGDGTWSWGCDIWADDNYEYTIREEETYEAAVEAALKYSLENLI